MRTTAEQKGRGQACIFSNYSSMSFMDNTFVFNTFVFIIFVYFIISEFVMPRMIGYPMPIMLSSFSANFLLSMHVKKFTKDL